MMLIKNMNAITLVALVITIVVMLILAAVAINLTLGNNGIFNRAKIAKEMYQNAEDYEDIEIGKTTNKIDEYIDGNRDVKLTDEVKKYIDSKLNRSAISSSSSSSYNSSNSSKTKVTLSAADETAGTGLTIDDGGIKIGKGINSVLVSAYANSGSNDNASYAILIYLDETLKYESYIRHSGTSSDDRNSSTLYIIKCK